MRSPLRLRLVTVILALVMSLGGTTSPFARHAATLDDLAIVVAVDAGANPADICGHDGKALLAGVVDQACHAADASLLPGPDPVLIDLALSAMPVDPMAEPACPTPAARNPGHGCRAPPHATI